MKEKNNATCYLVWCTSESYPLLDSDAKFGGYSRHGHETRHNCWYQEATRKKGCSFWHKSLSFSDDVSCISFMARRLVWPSHLSSSSVRTVHMPIKKTINMRLLSRKQRPNDQAIPTQHLHLQLADVTHNNQQLHASRCAWQCMHPRKWTQLMTLASVHGSHQPHQHVVWIEGPMVSFWWRQTIPGKHLVFQKCRPRHMLVPSDLKAGGPHAFIVPPIRRGDRWKGSYLSNVCRGRIPRIALASRWDVWFWKRTRVHPPLNLLKTWQQ